VWFVGKFERPFHILGGTEQKRRCKADGCHRGEAWKSGDLAENGKGAKEKRRERMLLPSRRNNGGPTTSLSA